MKNKKKVMAWLLAVVMLLTNVDVVSAAEAVNTGVNPQAEMISGEVSDGDSVPVSISENTVSDNYGQEPIASDGDVFFTWDGVDVTSGEVTEPILYGAEGAGTIVDSGELDGLTWSVTDTGVLTIGGTNTSDELDVKKASDWPWHPYRESVTEAVVSAKNVKIMSTWFSECENMKEVDFTDFDTSGVVDMSYVFSECESLVHLDMSNFDTSNVTSMAGMFNECCSLSDLDVSNFDTSNVTSMWAMFSGCSGLTSLDLSNFNTANVTEMCWMFSECSSLTSLDLSNFNTANVTVMFKMFSNCSSLTSLDVSSFDTSKVTNMSSMFWYCSGLISLDVSSFDTSNVTSMYGMFESCSNLTSLDVSNFDTSNVKSMVYMFSNCYSLTSLDVSNFDTSNVEATDGMFYYCTGLTSLDVSNFDTSNVVTMSYMFTACNISSLDISGFDTSKVKSMEYMFYECSNLTSLDVSNFDTSNVADMEYMFYECSNLTSLDVSGFNTTNVKYMGSMFYNCIRLSSLDVSSFDTTNVTDMKSMFSGCSSLDSLDVSGFDTTSVTNMCAMFSGCSGLSSLDVNSFNTANVTDMSDLFSGCSGLISLDVSSFNTTNVTNMCAMFSGCSSLSSLDLSNFNTANVLWTAEMFRECSNLRSLDLSGFDTKNVTYMYSMFYKCSDLMILDISGFDMSKVTNIGKEYMFRDCSSLLQLHCMPHLQLDIDLPKTMVDTANAITYNEYLPKNLEAPVWLYAELRGSGTWNGLTWYVTESDDLYITGTYVEPTSGEATDLPWQTHSGFVEKVVVDAKNLTSMAGWFQNFTSLKKVNFSGLDTSVLVDGTNLFTGCTNLEQINVPKGLSTEIALPYTMYDGKFQSYTVLPQGRTLELTIYKGEAGEVDGLHWLVVNGIQTLVLSGRNTATTLPTRTEYPWKAYSGYIGKAIVRTENVISTAHWFEGCSALKTVDMSAFDSSNVQDMSYMFKGCSALVTLDVSSYDVGAVTDMAEIFTGCSRLKEIKVFEGLMADGVLPVAMYDDDGNRYVNFPKGLERSFWVRKMSYSGEHNGITWMLTDSGKLYIRGTDTTEEAPAEPSWGWLTYKSDIKRVIVSAKNVKSTSGWFAGCRNLRKVDLTDFDTSTVTDMSNMFKKCTRLTSVDLSGMNISSVTNMTGFLDGCTALNRIKVFKGLTLDVPLPTLMFDDTYHEHLAIPKGLEEAVWLQTETCSGEQNGIIWVIDVKGTLYLRGVDTSTEAVAEPAWEWLSYKNIIKKAVVSVQNAKSTSGWFAGCSKLKAIDVTDFNSSMVTDMSYMFKDCTRLTSLDLSEMNVSAVTDMTGFLDGCTALRQVKVVRELSLDVPLPTLMFDEAYNGYDSLPKGLEESIWLYVKPCAGIVNGISWVIDEGVLYICGTDTSTEAIVEATWGWLAYADKIEKAVVSAKEVKSTFGWFAECSKLETVDFTAFDTSAVINMSNMFKNCSSLSILDLSGMNISSVTDMTGLLDGCTALAQIKVFKGLALDVSLPKMMFDEAYNGYDSLPKGLEESIWLYVKPYSGIDNGISWVIDEGVLYICGTDTSTEAVEGMTWGWLAHKTMIEKAVISAKEVKSTSGWFAGCNRLAEVDMRAFDMGKVTLTDKMFDGCTALWKVLTPLSLNNVVSLPEVFVDETDAIYYTLPKNQTNSILLEKVTAHGTYCGLDWVLIGGDKLIVSGIYAEKVPTDIFWGTYAADVKTVKISATGVKSTADWFKGMSGLESLDLSQVDLSEVTDMSGMFSGCSKLSTLQLGKKIIANVTDMSEMFCGCSSLTDVDISIFKTDKVTDMSGTFKNCAKLTKLDMSHFVFTKGVNVTSLLEGCIGLAEICMPANLYVKIDVPKPLYNYLGELQSSFFPMHQPETEWYYDVSPVGEGELHASKVYPQIYTGKAIKPEIRVYDGATRLVEKKDYTISYKNNKNAYLTKDGENGTYDKKAPTIVVKGKGNYTNTETIIFDIIAKNLNDEDIVVNELVAVVGKKVQNPVPVLKYNGKKLVKNKDFVVEYPDLENPDMTDAYKAAGTYTVRVTGKGNFQGTRDIPFTIASGALMKKVKVSRIPEQNYNDGKAVEPEFTVTYKKATLEAGKDYTVEYVNNTEAGKASIILRGMGEYAGTKTVTFRIAGTSIAKATVSGLVDKEYNGQPHTQNLKVELNGKALTSKDYKVSYSKNINAGTATVVITGRGKYSGTIKKTFKIKAYNLTTNSKKLFKGAPSDLTVFYTKGGCTPAIDLIFNSSDMVVKKDYIVSYKNNKKVASSKDVKAPTIVIKGKGNFTGTVTIPFSILAKELQNMESPVKINVPDVAYSAKAGKYISKPVLTDANGKKLVAGTDYEKEIIYTLAGDNTNAVADSPLDKKAAPEAGSLIKVIVTGKGSYSGTIEATYRITPISFKSAKVKIEPQVYTGNNITLGKEDITVTMKGETLTYGVDYVIVEDSYKNNIKKGNATVTIKGIGNYGGEKKAKFMIVSKEFIWFWRLIL